VLLPAGRSLSGGADPRHVRLRADRDDEVADLLYLNFKAPDYAGHVYNMDDPRQAEVLGAVDEEIGRLADLLAERFGDGRSVLIVTADHGQCPEIDANGGVRIDPIQLEEDLNAEFGTSVFGLVQMVAPVRGLPEPEGAHRTRACPPRTWRRSSPTTATATTSARTSGRRRCGGTGCSERSFAAVLPASYIGELASTDLARFGATAYDDADPGGCPPSPGSSHAR
jgi:hypothetical protein